MSRAAKSRINFIEETVHLLGKRTDPNPYLLPNGSMRRAVNTWMTRAGVHTKRRGFLRWSNSLDRQVNKLFPYESGFIAHVGAGTGPSPYGLVRVSSAGAPTFYGNDGNWTPPTTGPGNWRVRAAVAGKDMFLTSGEWVYRLSGSTSQNYRKAGGLIAPSFDQADVTTVLSGTGGCLADGFCSAYRYVLGSTNNFQRQILGPVSGRVVVTNQSGTSGWVTTVAKNVKVRCLLPPEAVATGDFISLYRSAQIEAGSTPDDDLQLVFQKYLDATDVANGYVEITDVVPDALRGAFLYTSPSGGDGILQNNDPPPSCADIVLHKNRLFFLNCAQPAKFNLTILAVGGTSGIQANDTLQIVGSFTMTAKASPANPGEYGLVTSGSASFNIEQTAVNLVAAINKYASNTVVWAQYVSGENDAPGKINLYTRTPASGVSFQVLAGPGSQRECFSPALLSANATVNLARVSNVVTATAVSGNLSFKVGEQVSFIGFPVGSFGAGPFTVVATPTAASFTYAETGANATTSNASAAQVGAGASPVNTITTSTQDVFPNRVYYSKYGEFDAVPSTNFFDVGAQEADLVAGISANDQLWCWKRDGIIRLVGDDPTTFTPVDVDRTVVCNARETIVKFLGAPVGLTDRGFVQATISGLQYLSQPIQKELLDQMVGTQATYLDTISFAVPYDSDGQLLLFFASGRDFSTGAGGLICQAGYAFSAKANDWTDWSWDTSNGSGNGRTCGAVLGGQLYFGDRYKTASSSCYVYQERKARTAADYLDQLGDASTQAITSIVAPSVLTAHNPGRSKLFAECALLFEGTQPSVLTVDDANEWGSGGRHTIVPTSGYAARFWPFTNASAGRILFLTITHAVASEAFDLAGIQVSYMLEGIEAER